MKQDREDALKLGGLYGTHFKLPIFLAVVCSKLQHPDKRSDLTRIHEEIARLVWFVNQKKLHVPLDWCENESIMVKGIVKTVWHEDVRAMLLCMRLLVMQRYPEKVMKRWPGLMREVAVSDHMVEVQKA